jgi:sulfite exporter TauE/SafE
MLFLGLMYPLGAVLQGAIGSHVGVKTVTAATAALLLVVLGLVALFRPGALRALGDLPAAAGNLEGPDQRSAR